MRSRSSSKRRTLRLTLPPLRFSKGAAVGVLAITTGKQTWFWLVADIVIGVLLVLNLLLIAVVLVRRLRESFREQRAEQFRTRIEQLLAEHGPGTEGDTLLVRQQLGRFNELERPIAASMMIERLKVSSPEERERTLEWLRQVGAIEVLFRSVRRWAPWRRAVAIRVLGLAGAEEALPVLIERLTDRSRYVREAAARALGQIGDTRALPALAELHMQPGRVAAGIVYEALLAFGPAAAQVFSEGLYSPHEHVRVSSVFGVAALLEPSAARSRLERMLGDEFASVRAATADVLGRIGGGEVTEELARASRDEERSVRRAAVSALGSFDDPQAVQLALGALGDPDHDTAVRAGETLVRLSRLPRVGAIASAAVADGQPWPIDRARILASLGIV
jgi:HEAT repeats